MPSSLKGGGGRKQATCPRQRVGERSLLENRGFPIREGTVCMLNDRQRDGDESESAKWSWGGLKELELS